MPLQPIEDLPFTDEEIRILREAGVTQVNLGSTIPSDPIKTLLGSDIDSARAKKVPEKFLDTNPNGLVIEKP